MPPALAAVLAIDASAGAGWLAVLGDEGVLARREWPALSDAAARLPLLAADALAEAGVPPHRLEVVAVVAGPGSYTGLRASLAFAHGLVLATGAVLIPVTVDEAGLDGQHRTPESVAWVAGRRRAGLLAQLAPLPLYAGPAQARVAPMRPAPA